MNKFIDVAIVGAGLYGLSVAAHLRKCRLEFRIFGGPGQTWLAPPPTSMRLNSEECTSSLSDPERPFTLENYCREQGLSFVSGGEGEQVSPETFAQYILAFQQRLAPSLERATV